MIGEHLTWFDGPIPNTKTEIDAFEQAIGRKLPRDYREFMLNFGSGYLNETDFEFDDGGKVYGASVGELMPIGDTMRESMSQIEFLPAGLVPFALDGGGNYTCFDYRTSDDPQIVFWHHEHDVGDDTSFVCNTFTDLIGLLHLPEDDEFDLP